MSERIRFSELDDPQRWFGDNAGMATPAEYEAYAAQYPGIEAAINTLTVGERTSFFARSRADAHAHMMSFWETDRAKHNAYLAAAWAITRVG